MLYAFAPIDSEKSIRPTIFHCPVHKSFCNRGTNPALKTVLLFRWPPDLFGGVGFATKNIGQNQLESLLY